MKLFFWVFQVASGSFLILNGRSKLIGDYLGFILVMIILLREILQLYQIFALFWVLFACCFRLLWWVLVVLRFDAAWQGILIISCRGYWRFASFSVFYIGFEHFKLRFSRIAYGFCRFRLFVVLGSCVLVAVGSSQSKGRGNFMVGLCFLWLSTTRNWIEERVFGNFGIIECFDLVLLWWFRVNFKKYWCFGQ